MQTARPSCRRLNKRSMYLDTLLLTIHLTDLPVAACNCPTSSRNGRFVTSPVWSSHTPAAPISFAASHSAMSVLTELGFNNQGIANIEAIFLRDSSPG